MWFVYRRCKNCGQFYIVPRYVASAKPESSKLNYDLYEVFDSLQKKNKYETDIDFNYCARKEMVAGKVYYSAEKNRLLEDLSFLAVKKRDDGKWEYTINDYEEYSNVLKNIDKDNVALGVSKDVSFKCPICESVQIYETYLIGRRSGDYYLESGFKEEDVVEFNKNHYEEDSRELEPTYNYLILNCQNSVEVTQSIDQLPNVNIQIYLKGLLLIKTVIFSLEQRLKDLIHQQYTANQNYINTEYKLKKYGADGIRRDLAAVNDSIDRIADKKSFTIPADWYISQHIEKPIKPEKPVAFSAMEPVAPEYKKPGLFNKKAVLAENETLKAKYENELTEWRQQKAEYETALDLYETKIEEFTKNNEVFMTREAAYIESEYLNWINQLAESDQQLRKLLDEKAGYEKILLNPDKYINDQITNSSVVVIKEMADGELNECINSLKKAYQAEKDYLSPNILFPKYATLPAVSTIYEYLVSGRCSELTGPAGAYNLYESEIRADRVIEQLDSINEKLDQIKVNQYMLYQAVQSVGSQLSSLNRAADKMTSELRTMNSTLGDIRGLAAVTAYNTAQTAYYSKVNAELTNSLGYLIAMK